jgi:hypothetical protein
MFSVTDNKPTDTFHPGDRWYIGIKNNSHSDLYVHVIYQNTEKESFRLTFEKGSGSPKEKSKSLVLRTGEEARCPGEISDTLGTDLITVLISNVPLVGAEERHENMMNRVAHEFRSRQPFLLAQKTYRMKTEKKQ